MNREELAQEATQQYSAICSIGESLEHAYDRSAGHRFEMNRAGEMRDYARSRRKKYLADLDIDIRSNRLALASRAAKGFYEKNHAELYDLAREEMEASGIPFNDPSHNLYDQAKEEMEAAGVTYSEGSTAYRFGEEIAGLERVSPVDALGAKIVHIAQEHMNRVAAELS